MQNTIAFIPVRGGSKSIPLKNVQIVNGKPLIWWSLKAALDCKKVEKIYVATDDVQIKNIVVSFQMEKVIIYDRETSNATDTATTESVMLEFASKFNFETIVLIQATNPFIKTDHLNEGLEKLKNFDSIVSLVRQKRFIWTKENSQVKPNYNLHQRPRRQDWDGFLVENGSFYITKKSSLLKTKHRLSGKIGYVEMPEESYIEIDEPCDLKIADTLLAYYG